MSNRIKSFALLSCLFALPAFASEPSFEFWTGTEFQFTLSPETDPELAWHDVIPDRFRVFSELQYANDLGLQQLLVRMGPIWNLMPWLTVASHFTAATFPAAGGSYGQEIRLELEPTFKGTLFPNLNWSNRNRFEYRIRADRQFWRLRHRLSLNYRLPESDFTPFIGNELFFEPSGAGFSQNRFLLGLSYQVSPSAQISLSYLNRQVLHNLAWVTENGLVLSLIYTSNEEGIFQMFND